MKKLPDDQLTELTEEPMSIGSDSEPSVDNFDQTELKEMLEAALDLKEGEVDPFERQEDETEKERKREQERAKEREKERNNQVKSVPPSPPPQPSLQFPQPVLKTQN